jgi:hypothetical protein
VVSDAVRRRPATPWATESGYQVGRRGHVDCRRGLWSEIVLSEVYVGSTGAGTLRRPEIVPSRPAGISYRDAQRRGHSQSPDRLGGMPRPISDGQRRMVPPSATDTMSTSQVRATPLRAGLPRRRYCRISLCTRRPSMRDVDAGTESIIQEAITSIRRSGSSA